MILLLQLDDYIVCKIYLGRGHNRAAPQPEQQPQIDPQIQAHDPQLDRQLQTDHQVHDYDPQLYQQQPHPDQQVHAYAAQLYQQQLQTDRQVHAYDPQLYQQQLQTDRQVQAHDPQLYQQRLQTDQQVHAYDHQIYHQQLQTDRQLQAYPQYYSPPNYQQNSNPPNQYFENSGFNNINDFSIPPPDDLAFHDVPSPPPLNFENSGFNNINDFSIPPPDDLAFHDVPSPPPLNFENSGFNNINDHSIPPPDDLAFPPPPLQTTGFDFNGYENFPVSDQQCNHIYDPNLLLPDCHMYDYNYQQSLQSNFPVDQQQSNYGMNRLSSFQPAGQALNSGYSAQMNTPNCYTNAQFDQPSTLNVIPNSCPSVQINQPSTSDALITRKRTRPPQCEEQEMQRMAKAQRMANAPMNTPNCYTNAQFDQPSTSNAIPNSYASAQINQPSTSNAPITRKRTGTPECDPDQEQEMQRMVKAQRRF